MIVTGLLGETFIKVVELTCIHQWIIKYLEWSDRINKYLLYFKKHKSNQTRDSCVKIKHSHWNIVSKKMETENFPLDLVKLSHWWLRSIDGTEARLACNEAYVQDEEMGAGLIDSSLKKFDWKKEKTEWKMWEQCQKINLKKFSVKSDIIFLLSIFILISLIRDILEYLYIFNSQLYLLCELPYIVSPFCYSNGCVFTLW